MFTEIKSIAISVFIAIGVVAVLLLTTIGASRLIFNSQVSNGIHIDAENETVYIAGESCTINTPLEISYAHIQHRVEFCMYKHSLWQQLLDVETQGIIDSDSDLDTHLDTLEQLNAES
jgi:hypothetical protein